MAIYIKGVELPKGDEWLGLNIRIYEDGTVWEHIGFGDYNLTELKAVNVPEPHGRLIDVDTVGWAKHIPDVGYLSQYQEGWNGGVDYMLGEIDDAPTVIEGSGE